MRHRFTRSSCAIALLGGWVLVGCSGQQIGLAGASEEGGESILSIISGPTPQEAAEWAVDPFDSDKRARGLLLLANAPWGGEPVYVDLYRAALNDGDNGVRAIAVKSLALHGEPSDVPAIVEQTTSENLLLRRGSTRALQRLHNPEFAVPALLERVDLANEKDPQVRTEAASALGQYAETRVFDALVAALDDRDLAVNMAARESLETLTGTDHEIDARAWLAWKEETGDLFANQQTYMYPVFERDQRWYEWILPGFDPPNETSAPPVGMPPVTAQGATASNTRQN